MCFCWNHKILFWRIPKKVFFGKGLDKSLSCRVLKGGVFKGRG